MTEKTYGAWKITQREYETARNLSTGSGPLSDAAYQLVRYCRGQVFNLDAAREAAKMIRANS